MGVSFGIMFANSALFAQPEMAAAQAQAAERAGVESLWTVEHVVVPANYTSTYPYSETGKAPGAEVSDIPDPLIWLAFVAAHTTTIRLATGILILPQRNPVVLAKEVATLDQLSKGRVTLGIGVGWLEEEFRALGVPFERRGHRTDDYVHAMRTLWAENPASYHGPFVNFDNCISLPKPPQGRVPMVIGGHTEAAARRAGRLGDGFFPGKGSVQELHDLLQVVRNEADRAGRDMSKIELTTGYRADPEVMNQLIDLGFTRFIVGPQTYNPTRIDAAYERFGNDVIARWS